jgi:hypothetical protein
MAKFKRKRKMGRPTCNTGDSVGTVRVVVYRVEHGKQVVGNINRCISIDEAKVSTVISAIEDALLEGDESDE